MSYDNGATTTDSAISSDRMVEQSIEIMQRSAGLCVHPLHYHSFQSQTGIQSVLSNSLSFSRFYNSSSSPKNNTTNNINLCILCSEEFSTLSSRMIPQIFQRTATNTSASTKKKKKSDEPILKCLACHVLAHRSCATSTTPVVHDQQQNVSVDTDSSKKPSLPQHKNAYQVYQQCAVNRSKIMEPLSSSSISDNVEEHLTLPFDDSVVDEIHRNIDPTSSSIIFTSNDHNIQHDANVRKMHDYPGNRVLEPPPVTSVPHDQGTTSSTTMELPNAVVGSTTTTPRGTSSSGPAAHLKLIQSVTQNVSIPAVAGGIAGGLAGMALLGPAGAVYACYLGAGGINVLLGLESAATLGLVAAGIATGTITGNKINEHVDETKQRIITMSDPYRRTVLLVRPNIVIDPIWDQICLDAVKSAPKSAYSRQQRRQNNQTMDADIIDTHEDEIDTNDKILLLVSRILNDGTSLPGYVLRYFIQRYNDRCRDRTTFCANNQSVIESNPRVRRDDAHAIIKHVTATLLNVRPECGSSQRCTELTASAVESIVFGQIYDSILEEIINETLHDDTELWRRITVLLKYHPELLDIQYQEPKLKDQSAIKSNVACHMPLVSSLALDTLKMIHGARSVSDKLHFCVKFIDTLSAHYTTVNTENSSAPNDTTTSSSLLLCADTLIQMVCQHIVLAENFGNMYAQIRFLEDFASDEQLVHGYDGYALVTIQAALHTLQQPLQEGNDAQGWYNDIFG